MGPALFMRLARHARTPGIGGASPPPPPPPPTWTFGTAQVQSVGGGDTVAVTLSAGVAAGDLVSVWLSSFSTGTTAVLSDNMSNSYSQIGGYVNSPGNDARISAWWAKATATGSLTVTALLSQADFASLAAANWTPSAGTIGLDSHLSASVAFSPAPSVGSIPVTGTNDLCTAGLAFGHGHATAAAGAGWTMRAEQLDASDFMGLLLESVENVSSAQTGNFTMTDTSSPSLALIGVSFSI